MHIIAYKYDFSYISWKTMLRAKTKNSETSILNNFSLCLPKSTQEKQYQVYGTRYKIQCNNMKSDDITRVEKNCRRL